MRRWRAKPQQEEEELRLTFLEHLEELRTRMIRGLVALVVCSGVGYYFRRELLTSLLPQETVPIALNPAEHFFPYIELAIVVGLLLSLPFQLYQVWAFVAPGLYRSERRYVMPLVVASSACFYAGVAFAHLAIVPLVLSFLAQFSEGQIEAMYSASLYLRFYLKMIVAFGISFNAPVVIVLLSLLEVVQARTLSRARPYIVVGIFTVAAVLTPPDWFSQVLLGGPLWVLFEIGLAIARVIEWRRGAPRSEERGDDETDGDDAATVARGA